MAICAAPYWRKFVSIAILDHFIIFRVRERSIVEWEPAIEIVKF